MGVVDGIQDFPRAILRGSVTVLHGEVLTQHALGVAGVAGGDEQIAAANAQIQIAGCLFGEFNAQFSCFIFGIHERGL